MTAARPTRATSRPARLLAGAVLLAVSVVGAACSGDDDEGTSGPADVVVIVSSTDDACSLSTTTAAAGNVGFDVTNDGGAETEFYVYESDGKKIVGEVENIGPGISRSLTVELEPGTYVTACKPGMTGEGIRAEFTVTEAAAAAASDTTAA